MVLCSWEPHGSLSNWVITQLQAIIVADCVLVYKAIEFLEATAVYVRQLCEVQRYP